MCLMSNFNYYKYPEYIFQGGRFMSSKVKTMVLSLLLSFDHYAYAYSCKEHLIQYAVHTYLIYSHINIVSV